MKKLLSVILALTMCAALFAGAGLTVSADESIDRYLNATGGTLVFDNDAGHPWAYDSISIGKYGASAGNSGVDSSSSAVSTTAVFAEGQGVYFTWKVSSQQKWDYLAFSVDGVEKARISGVVGPEDRVFAVEAGEHVLTWTYVKDEAYSLYDDKGYLDEVHIGAYYPSATNVDAALNVAGGSMTFENDASEPWTARQGGGAASGNAGKSASGSAVTLRTQLEAGRPLCFDWGVSSESKHDLLVFEVNGEEIAAISGEVAYPNAYSYVAEQEGEYVFRWIYRKDTLGDFGSDRGYLGNVRVTDYVGTTGVITAKATTIAAGKSLKMTFATKPTNATSRAMIWTTGDDKIATVDENGVVTGVSAGSTSVTVTTAEGGFSSVCALTVTPFAGDYEYYVDSAAGNDRNKGTSPNAPFRTLHAAYTAIYTNVPSGGSVKLTITGAPAVTEEFRIFDKDVNVVSVRGAYSRITRAANYTGPIFRVASGGRLRLGDTEEGGKTLTVGGSKAAAPCVIVDGGELTLYPYAEISGNNSSVSGAGVYVKSGALNVIGGAITGNSTSRYGGGVYAEGGSVVISAGSVTGNTAGVYGGGAYISTQAEHSIDETLVSGNTARSFDEICYGEAPAAPVVSGIEDGAEYSLEEYPDGVSASWTSAEEATATLDGEPYEAGTPITAEGDHVLTVTDGFSVVSVAFNLFTPVHEQIRAEAFISDNEAGETGFAGFDINGGSEPERYAVSERPVAAAEYVAGKIRGYSEDGYFFTADTDALAEGETPYSNMVWSEEAVIDPAYTVLDMTYDYVTRNFIVLLADEDNKRFAAPVDPDSGEPEGVVPIVADAGEAPALMTVAADMNGAIYGVSAGDNAALWAVSGVNETGAVVTKLFDLGVEAYYLQSMTFDRNSGKLYWAQCGKESGGIYEIDIENDTCSRVGAPLGEDAELTAFIIRYDIDVNEERVSSDGRFIYTLLPEGGAEIVGYNFKNDAGEPNFEKFDEDTFLVEVPGEVDGVTVLSIGKYAFRDRSVGEDPAAYMQIGKAVLPESVETVGYGAFRGCVSLKEIEFGGQEKEIGEYAFYQCRSLTDVNIPWPIETIGYGAFSECAGLEKATVTGPTENIGDYAFYNVSENFELWGHWPSATYDHAQANGLTFRDLDPYEAPVVTGVEDGALYVLADKPDGVSIGWIVMRFESATLDGEPYEEGTPVTAPGEHTFTVSDGRTPVTVTFTIVETLFMKGDFDFDGEITVADALAALRIAAKLAEETSDSVLIGDTDGDGHVTVADALAILRVAAKLADQSSLG